VFIPERLEDLNIFEDKIKAALEIKKSSIIIVSEGDQVGGAKELYNYLEERGLSNKVRVSVLGHMQRGGSPSYKDRMLSTLFGAKAVELIVENDANQIVGTKNGEIYTYKIKSETTKKLPKDMHALKLVKKLSRY
jgi:6-phosphofructokinase 1